MRWYRSCVARQWGQQSGPHLKVFTSHRCAKLVREKLAWESQFPGSRGRLVVINFVFIPVLAIRSITKVGGMGLGDEAAVPSGTFKYWDGTIKPSIGLKRSWSICEWSSISIHHKSLNGGSCSPLIQLTISLRWISSPSGHKTCTCN